MSIVYTTFDTVTGEVFEERILKSNEQVKVTRNLTSEQRKYNKNKWDVEAMTRSQHGFVWVFYFNNELLFTSDTLSKANVARLMMLATYMNYENALVLDDTVNEKVIKFKGAVEYMNKKDIQHVLNLTNGTFKQFYKEVTEARILVEADGRYSLSNEHFYKGEINSKRKDVNGKYTRMYVKTVRQIYSARILVEADGRYSLSNEHFYKGEINSKRKDVNGKYTRMYVKTVRQIYSSMRTSKHTLLSYVFQLIPCIHYSTNFLCKDMVSPYKSIDYMNIEDICNYLGLSTDKDNMRKMKKELMSIHVECNGRMAHLINEVTVSSSTQNKQRFLFNPHVVTSISQKEEINQIMQSLFVE